MDQQQQKFVAYYRVSTREQGQSGLGLDAQQDAVRLYLQDKGWPPIAELQEVESGRSKRRPQLDEALRLCRVHGAALIVAKVDRLSRNAYFLLSIIESGIEVIFLDLPVLGSGPVSTFILQQMASVAQLESAFISQRTKAALAQSKIRGVKLGGYRGQRPSEQTRLMGAQARADKADARAKDLRVAIDHVIGQGHASYQQIAKALSAGGIPTPSGRGEWAATMVSRVMSRTGVPVPSAPARAKAGGAAVPFGFARNEAGDLVDHAEQKHARWYILSHAGKLEAGELTLADLVAGVEQYYGFKLTPAEVADIAKDAR